MSPQTPEMLWNRVLANGPDTVADRHSTQLRVWIGSGGGALPASVAEAARVRTLAGQWMAEGAVDAAVAAFRLAMAGLEHLGRLGEADLLDAHRELATALLKADQLAEAEAELERLSIRAASVRSGRTGWEALILYHRAALADRKGLRDDATVLLRRALGLAEDAFGPGGGWSEIIRRALANALAFQGHDMELVALCREAARHAAADPLALRPWLLQLAEQLTAPDEEPEREAVLRRLVELSDLAFGPLEQAEDRLGLGRCLMEAGRVAEASAPLNEAARLTEALDAEPGLAAACRYWQAEVLAALPDGDPEAIHAGYRAAIAGFTQAGGAGDDATFLAEAALGRFLMRIGLPEEAERVLAAALERAEAVGSSQTAAMADSLAQLRRRRLAVREKGRLFGWALAQEKGRHGADRLALALAVLRQVAAQAEAADTRNRLAAAADAVEAAARLSRGDRDATMALLAGLWAGADPRGGLTAVAEMGGEPVLALAESLLPEALRSQATEIRMGECLSRGDLDRALVLLAELAEPESALIRDASQLALLAGRKAEARSLALRLDGTAFDLEAARLLLELDEDAAALGVIGNLASGTPFVTGAALAARHCAAKGDRALFLRRASEAFGHLVSHPDADGERALGLVAAGALDLMGKDQALVWAAGQLPDHLVSGFARAMGRALEEKRGLGPEVEAGVLGAELHALAELGRWDDAAARLGGLSEAGRALDACLRLAETAGRAGQPEAAARFLKHGFTRLSGTGPAMARRLGEAVARLLPQEWRDGFADAALSRAASLEETEDACTHVVAAAFAAMEMSPPQSP